MRSSKTDYYYYQCSFGFARYFVTFDKSMNSAFVLKKLDIDTYSGKPDERFLLLLLLTIVVPFNFHRVFDGKRMKHAGEYHS